MSVWSAFGDFFSGLGKGGVAVSKAIPTAVTNIPEGIASIPKAFGASGTSLAPGGASSGILQGAVQFGTQQVAGQMLATNATDLSNNVKTALQGQVTTNLSTQAKQYDPLLVAGQKLEQDVFSPYVKRPISALALMTDPSSPLYTDGKYGAGLQLSDFQAAYNRSADVSLGVALTKSWINPFHISGTSDMILASGGIDIDKVNLWDDADVKKNFVDNTLGRYMSGITDAVVGNAAIAAATGGSVNALKNSAARAGLTNTLLATDVKSLSTFESRINEHLDNLAGSPSASKTTLGSDVERLAKSKDVNEILDILKPHTSNPNMANLIRQTEDPAIVRDFILADKGYAPAIQRLANAKMSDDLWILGDASKELNAQFASKGKMPEYTFEQRKRVEAAFNDSIAKNPKHQEIYDAFLRDESIVGPVTPEMAARGIVPGATDSVPRVFGKAWQPIDPIIGANKVISARARASELRVAAKVRDFSNVGGMTQTLIGRNGAATALIKFVSTKMPRGVVTNSGIRPLDAIEEFNAHFDDIKSFKNGFNQIKISPTESISAKEYRTNFIQEYLSAQTDSERGLVIDKLNDKLILDLARTHGIPQKQVQSFLEDAMGNLRSYHNNLARDAFSMDPSGVRVKVDPETQRQLRNATVLIPAGAVEREMLLAKKGVLGNAANVIGQGTNTVYEFGNRAFSFTQLVRPSYIGKNSIIEPVMVSFLSHGSRALTDAAPTMLKNFISNNKTRALKVMTGVKGIEKIPGTAKNELVKEFTALNEQYAANSELLDHHIAEYIQYFDDNIGRSPSTKLENAAIVKRDLNAAERALRNVEEKLNAAAPEYTVDMKKQPTLYGLTRRVKYLESLNNAQYASDIANAKSVILKAAGDINTLTPDLKAIDANIAKVYADLEKNIAEFGPLHAKKADMFSVSEKRVIEYGTQVPADIRLANGDVVSLPQFGDRNHMGTGWQSEVANTHAKQIEITGNQIFGQKINMFNRRGPREITAVNSPHYFDELAYVANTYMKGDVLVDRILSGATRKELIDTWANTRQAASYANEFGKEHGDIVSIIDNQIAYINRYLPSKEAQLALARGEVNGNQLSRLLADQPQLLTPIHPLDVAYGLKNSEKASFAESMNRLTTAAWVKLATPENKIRYAWASTEFKDRATDKLNFLANQGYELTPSVVNGIRQSAAAEVVQELDKTFYSVRRANRALFMARTIAAFPTASASGIYRYARLAVKNPERMAGFLTSYYGLYRSFGVDKYGNPVKDPMKAEFLVVPGTKEMGINGGKGLMFSPRATNFMVNFAGPSWLVPIGLGQAYSMMPSANKYVKKAVDSTIGHIPGYSYDELFPYGISTDIPNALGKTVTPGWLPTLRKWIATDGDGSVDWINSLTSEYEYQGMLYDMGLGPKPTEASVKNAAHKNFQTKFLWQFMSIIGSPAYVETKPMGIYQNYFNARANAHLAEGMTRTEAAKAAEQDMNANLRLPAGQKFPVDRLKQKAFTKAIYAPASQETIDRIWVDHAGLAEELALKDPGGSLVGLMTADLPPGTNPQASIFLNDPNRKLPGGDVLNNTVKTIAKQEAELEKSRYWKAYVDLKNSYNDAAKKAGYSSYRSVPELTDALKGYAETLGKASPIWNAAYRKSVSGDNAVLQAIGMRTILNNENWMKKVGNKSNLWVEASKFMEYRDSYAAAYADAPTGGKKIILDAWLNYLDTTHGLWDPALQNIIDRDFLNDSLRETNVAVKKPKEKK